MLLSEVICHKDFQWLMVDMEIFVDHIASMQIDNLNYGMGAAWGTIFPQKKQAESGSAS